MSDSIKTYYLKSKKMLIVNERIRIDERFEKDKDIAEHTSFYADKLKHDLNIQCGYIENDLESRFMYLRT